MIALPHVLLVLAPLAAAVLLAAPVGALHRSWRMLGRAAATALFGIVIPVGVFLLAVVLQPDWKGACHRGWVDCFHAGKLLLCPVVLWAGAGLYALSVARAPNAAAWTWVRWGVLNGAVVGGLCLVQGVATAGDSLLVAAGWGYAVPLYTTVWYAALAWRCWRGVQHPARQTGCALLPSLPFWAASVVESQRLYRQLPDVAPNCFVVTAASRGHPALVGACWRRGPDGRLHRVNAQLLAFRALEAVGRARWPAVHARCRRVYDVWGPRMAACVRRRWAADAAYLLLKPAEWVARAILRRAARPDPASPSLAASGEAATPIRPWRRRAWRAYAAGLALIGVYFFLAPGIIVCANLCDPALRRPGIPAQARRLHRALAPRLADWARERIASGRAAHLPLHDVPSTEWPIFGSVFYLWATEALQADWERQDPARRGTAPAVCARPALDAAIAVIADPVHHTWVRQHWGDDYLHTQNCFFRSLLIAGIASHARLTGDTRHLPLLRDQVTTLAAELDASPAGLLQDYPGECYPIDVVCAVACIRRGAGLFGLDVRPFVERERRAFTGRMLDRHGLPPYVADWRTGEAFDCSRGVGNSHTLIFAPELWPDLAAGWYAAYARHFWQERWWAAGFREYPRDAGKPENFFEIDAGPVIAGFSPAANAFGLAATRLSGRFDHAWTLGAQIAAVSWPLPHGTLLGPRILSGVGAGHAPYLGETALLFHLTQNPPDGTPVTRGGRLTPFVWFLLAFYFGGGAVFVAAAGQVLRRARYRLSPAFSLCRRR
jgi:hypothetical protein